MSRLAWLTPDDAPEGSVELTLSIPQGIEWEAIVRGLLIMLLDTRNFEEYGSYSPEDTVAEFAGGINDLLENWPSP